jgi:hypothetical protein
MATMRYHKLAARTAAALCSALALAGVAATSAGAAQNATTTYSGASLCVKGRAIQFASNVGFGSREADAYADPYRPDCVTPLALPVGYVATKADVYKWNGSAWAYCNGTNWLYDGYRPPRVVGDLTFSATYGAHAISSAGACGPGYYGVNAAAFAWANNSWNGNWVWSGFEYMP